MLYEVVMNVGLEALKRGKNDDALRAFTFAEAQTNASEEDKARRAHAQQMQTLVLALGGEPVDARAAIRRTFDELVIGTGTKQNLLLLMRRASRQDRFKDLVSSVRLVRSLVHETTNRATGLISTAVAGGTRLLK